MSDPNLWFDVGDFAYAHRGLWDSERPENSLAAFRAAAAAGVGCELDVRVTADGRLVVFHDTTLERMCGTDVRIDALDLSEVRQQRLPDGSLIPTLEEALNAIGNLPTLIEIKVDLLPESIYRNRKAMRPVIDLLTSTQSRAAVMSFDEPTVWSLVFAKDGVGHRPLTQPVGQLIDKLDAIGADRVRVIADRARSTGDVFLAPHLSSLQSVAEAHPGVPLTTWTVRDPVQLKLAQDHAAAPIFEGFSPALVKSSGTPI